MVMCGCVFFCTPLNAIILLQSNWQNLEHLEYFIFRNVYFVMTNHSKD